MSNRAYRINVKTQDPKKITNKNTVYCQDMDSCVLVVDGPGLHRKSEHYIPDVIVHPIQHNPAARNPLRDVV